MNPGTIDTKTIESTLGVGKKKRSRRWLYIGLALLLIGGVTAYLTLSKKEKPVAYDTAPVTKKDLTVTVSATGNLEPTNTVSVGIEVSGTISEVTVDYNQRIKKGDILARIDTTKLKAQVKNSEASLLVAQANLSESRVARDNAKTELERGQKMYDTTKGNYPSEKEMAALRNTHSQAVAAYDAAKARVAQAEAQLQSDQDNLKKAVVIAPFDGIVLDRKIDPGQTVAATLQTPELFTLAEDLTKMEVVVSVDEADVGQVKEGQKVRFTVDAYPDRHFDGVITQVRLNSEIVSGVVTYETVVEVANTDMLLRPGMTASADIITQVLPDALTVPNRALRFVPPSRPGEAKAATLGGTEKGVWVLENGQPKHLPVTVLETDGIDTAISGAAIREGLQVITGTKTEH